MLSKTTRISKPASQFLNQQCENQAAYLELLREKVQTILEELVNEKKTLEDRYCQERRAIMEQLDAREEQVDRLELRVRQLQKENQQIRYQYDQRVSLMKILKQQNWLISKQFSEEKDRMQATIQYLTRENQSLKDIIIKNTYYLSQPQPQPQPQPQLKSLHFPKKYPQFIKQPQFYSMTDLKPTFHHKRTKLKLNKYHQSQDNQPSIDNSISRSSMAQALKKRESQFKQSRITQAKPTGKWKQCGLQRMSAITYLSRQDD